jgi:hypothetical protein
MKITNIHKEENKDTFADLVNDDGLVIVQGSLTCIYEKIKSRGYRVEGVNAPIPRLLTDKALSSKLLPTMSYQPMTLERKLSIKI